jgi:hypothetical protein
MPRHDGDDDDDDDDDDGRSWRDDERLDDADDEVVPVLVVKAYVRGAHATNIRVQVFMIA